jgi:hypothetical protein
MNGDEKLKQQFSPPPVNDLNGDLAFAIAPDAEHNVIAIRFAKPVVWLTLDPETAVNFCHVILEKVNQLAEMRDSSQESPSADE